MEDEFIRGAEEAGHDGKGGLKRNADDLAMILENLGNRVRQIIWANVSGRRAKRKEQRQWRTRIWQEKESGNNNQRYQKAAEDW